MSHPDKSKLVQVCKNIDRSLSYFESAVLILTLSSMIFFAFSQVILRNFFNAGILWGDMFVRHLVLWVGFLGASLATREDRHINIDALWRILSKKWQRRTKILTNLFSAFICLLLARAAFVFVRDEFSAKTTLFLGIPSWILMSIILFGFSVITFRFLIKALMPAAFSKAIE